MPLEGSFKPISHHFRDFTQPRSVYEIVNSLGDSLVVLDSLNKFSSLLASDENLKLLASSLRANLHARSKLQSMQASETLPPFCTLPKTRLDLHNPPPKAISLLPPHVFLG